MSTAGPQDGDNLPEDVDARRVLGRTVVGTLTAAQIEWWPLATNVSEWGASGDELQALCPVTAQPDLYQWTVWGVGRIEPESKALKLYLGGFRDEQVSCASLASRIAHDLSMYGDQLVTVTLTQQTRGGMNLTATATGGNVT